MIQIIAKIMLWLAVVAWALWFGGLVYEMVVIMPLWSTNLPNSVLEWNSRPNFVINPTRFYLPIVLNWKSRSQKTWLILSTVCVITAFVFTLIYFFPKNEVLFRNQIAGLNGEEITAIANAWIRGNWIRVGMMTVGFFAALKAFGLPKDNLAADERG
jgi:Domain of unknown function (DUF1772)